MEFLDQFWAEMLSGDPRQIQIAWDPLKSDERAAVREHLDRMHTEAGWHFSQRESAAAALQTIEALKTQYE